MSMLLEIKIIKPTIQHTVNAKLNYKTKQRNPLAMYIQLTYSK